MGRRIGRTLASSGRRTDPVENRRNGCRWGDWCSCGEKCEDHDTCRICSSDRPSWYGLIESLARPGGNITGVALALGEGFSGKWVELLKEAVPKVGRVVVLR